MTSVTSPAGETASPMIFEERATASGHRIGFATLNRPRQLNALNLQMCQLMLDQFRAWQSDEGIVAVVLQGAGDKGFCAGGDVADVIRRVREGGPRRFVYGDAFFDVEYQLDYLIHTFRKPFIAYSHGVCMGGGVGLFAGASHRVLSEGTKLAMPEIHIGLFPDVGGGFFLNRVPAGIGRVLALTGLIINEADALFVGLADAFVPQPARETLWTDLLAQPFTGSADHDRQLVSAQLLAATRLAAAKLPESNLRGRFEALREIGAMPTVVAVRDALLAAAQADPWFKTPAASLANGSPTAAFVTFEYLTRCRHLSLREVLALDLVLATNFQRRPDFVEGVRALLIDKDKSPKWAPARFDDVDRTDVMAHFTL